VIGRALSHYQILEKIGSGGMGEVYRSLDTKLGREVAIKILPEAFARNAERVSRLRREAHVLAALNHPNIAAVYDLDECEGICFLVMELVPGSTLCGPLPVSDVVAVCAHVAEALEAAHEKGIVHRDLKPANVKITPSGRVKLLDFGLAKTGLSGGGPSSDEEPTQTDFTEPGALVGTVAYMSPEQVRGLAVDRRTDIWSFGCLLYELLAGRRLYESKTAPDILASILRDDPALEGLPDSTPAAVRTLLQRCLRREPGRRLRDIGDARIELEDVLAARMGPVVQPQPAAHNITFQRITDFVGVEESPAMSPDGKIVAFVSVGGGRRQIWIRMLAGGSPLQITHDEMDHEQPRWAPDSSSLIYFSPSQAPGEQGTIGEISALGGPARLLTSAMDGGDVSHDGRRVASFQVHEGRTVLALTAREGSGVEYLNVASDEHRFCCPRWSTDDRWIAFQTWLVDSFLELVYIIPATGGELREVTRAPNLRGFSWLPDSSGIVYSSSSGSTVLYPPIFNLRTVGRDGRGDRQLTFGDVSYVEPDVHVSGKLVASRIRIQSDVWRFPVTGSPVENTSGAVRITRQTGQAQTPSVSPDGKELAYLSDSIGHGNLWVAKTDGSAVRQITFERDPAVVLGVPVWSPASRQIAFIRSQNKKTGVWLIRPDGSGLRQILSHGFYVCWSADGLWVYYVIRDQRGYKIQKVPVEGGTPVPVQAGGVAPAVSPDGSTLYYTALIKGANGRWDCELRRQQMDDGRCEVLANIRASRVPLKDLYFHPVVSPDGRWLAVPLTDGVTSNIWAIPAEGGPLKRLTDFGDRQTLITRRISWSPDGNHIYAAVADTDADVILLDGLL